MIKYTLTINNAVKGLASVALLAGLMGCQNTLSSVATVQQDSQQTNIAAANADDGVICKMEKRIGSNMMTRVCRTAEQRAAQAEAGREGWLRLQKAGSTSNADG